MAQRDYEEICENLGKYSKNSVQCIDKGKSYYLRRIVINNYIILYRILEKEVEILRILPQKSNYLKSSFKKEKLIQK